MTVSLKHKFSSAKADSADTSLIRPSNWNDEHDLTLATDCLLGRDTTGAGAAEEITVAGGIEFTGAGGIQRSALTGDVTASAGSNTTAIANDAVTYAKIQNVSTNNKVLGRSTAGAGDIEELSVGTGLTLSGGTLSVTTNTYQPLDADLTAIGALAGTSGFLTKTAANTWSLDTSTYLTSAVTTINFGSTGLTPSTATSGAVTVAGTLGVSNGGTGATTITGLVKGNGTSAMSAAVANTDYQPASTWTNWSTNGVGGSVSGLIAWKNYGNNHVIFDASASTAPNGTAVNNTNSNQAWASSYPTLMGWNGSSTYGVRVDSARTADTVASLTPSADYFLVGNGSAWTAESPSAARASLSLGTVYSYNVGTSGATVPLCSTSNTFSGSQTISTGGFVGLYLTGAAGAGRTIVYQSSGSNRWVIGANNTNESGSNVGSNLEINRYSDGGALIDTAFSITRSSGVVTAPGVYANTNSGTANVVVTSAGQLRLSTSSIRYKKDVEDLDSTLADDAVANLRPVWYRSIDPNGDDKAEWSHIGLIAEEVALVEPRLVMYKTVEVSYNEDGERVETVLETPVPNGVDYARLSVILLDVVQRQAVTIKSLEDRVAALEGA